MDIRKFFSKAPASGGAKGGGGAKPAAPSSAKAKSPDKSKAKKPAEAESETPAKGSRKRSQAEDEVANGGGDEEEEVVEVPAKKKAAVAKPKEGGESDGAVVMDEDDGEVVEIVESPEAVAATTSRSTTDSEKKRTPTTRSSTGKKRAAAAKPKAKAQKGKKRRKTSLVSSDEESEEEEEEEEDDDEDFEAEEEEQEEEESSDDEEDEQPKRRRGAAAKPKPKPSPKKKPPTPAKKKEPTPKKAKTPVKKIEVDIKDDDDEDEGNEVEEVVPVKKDEPKSGGLKLTALSKAADKAAKPGGSETKRKLPSTLTGQAPPRQETSVSSYFNMTEAPQPAANDDTKTGGSAGPSPSKVNKDAPAAVKKDTPIAVQDNLFDDDDDDEVQVVKEEKPAVKPEAAKKQEVKSPSPAAVKSPEKGGRPAWRGLERSGPLKPGAREVPEGSPECLDGLTFVVTGVMETLGREEIDDYIKRHGGRVTGSVSGKTSYLVRGIKLEDERPVEQGKKYQNAVEKKVKILTEAELFDMVSSGGPEPSDRPGGKKSTPKKKPAPPPYRPGAASSSSTSGKGRASDASLQPVIPSEGMLSGENDLWADKYKPRSIQELVGGQDTANKLKNWLNNWDAVHRTKTKPAPGFNKENPGAKAVLLSGPPGIGKSTTAGLVARLEGFTVLELNASDTRSKRTLADELSTVLDNTALPTSNDVKGRAQHRRAVIMDEVDGMSGSDRGGIQELIKLIKLSKVPIICICNDRQHQKIRSLVNHCYDLRVKRPQRPQIAARMMDIAKREGLTVERNAIEIVIESVGNDIRQVLNTMQMWQKTSSRMGYADVKNRMSSIDKDSQHRISAFDAGKMILCESRSKPFFDRYNAFFIDYSLLPLLIQHNYVDCIKNMKNETLVQRLDRLEAASATLSDADLVSRMIMGGDQHWELLPLQAALNVKVGYHTTGMIPFPQFPAWLGKNSAKGKRRRLVQEMTMHMAGRISGGPQAVRLSYLPALKQRIIGLLQGGADHVDEVIELLDEYGLSREDVMESMTEFGFDQQGQGKDVKDPLKELDSKVKAALTREYNKTVHKSQGLNYSLYQVKKGRKGAAAASGGGGEAGGGGGGAGAVDEEGAPLETEAGEALAEENAEEETSVGEEEDLSIFKKKGRGSGGKGGGAAAAGPSSSSSGGGGGGSGKGRRGGGAASGKGKERAKK